MSSGGIRFFFCFFVGGIEGTKIQKFAEMADFANFFLWLRDKGGGKSLQLPPPPFDAATVDNGAPSHPFPMGTLKQSYATAGTAAYCRTMRTNRTPKSCLAFSANYSLAKLKMVFSKRTQSTFWPNWDRHTVLMLLICINSERSMKIFA